MPEVTSENFAERLLRSAEQAAAIKRGEMRPSKASRRKVTARRVTVTEPPRYGAKAVATIREKMGASQPVFARALGVNPVTVKAWEQGKKTPSGPTRRLLEVAERHPEVFAEFVKEK